MVDRKKRRRPQPVVGAGLVAGIISGAFVMALRKLGFPVTDDLALAIGGLVVAAIPVVLAWWASRRVTPMSDPRLPEGTHVNDGTSLVQRRT